VYAYILCSYAGALEAAFAILAIRDGRVPLTLNLINPDPDSSAFKHVFGASADVTVDVAISNSFGFGGTNASLMFSRI
jgi:3-oxoacyl-[acyl-carrier-protein] synthase II